jgi:hypothetical protein
MTFLLDTCVISKLRKKNTEEGRRLKEWAGKYDSASFFISALTIGEIQFGIAKLPDREDKIKNALQSWVAGVLIPSFENRILSIDFQIGSLWGTMSARALRKGIVLPMGDALIAATAVRHDLIVVTQNTRHFAHTGARLFDPLA